MFIKAILKSLSCASIMLEYSRPTVVGLLGSSGDMLSWLLLIMFISCCLGFWVWEDCSSKCFYLVLSLLSGCFVPLFLVLSLVLGECSSCGLLGRKFFWCPDKCGHWGFLVKCF